MCVIASPGRTGAPRKRVVAVSDGGLGLAALQRPAGTVLPEVPGAGLTEAGQAGIDRSGCAPGDLHACGASPSRNAVAPAMARYTARAARASSAARNVARRSRRRPVRLAAVVL